MLKRSLSSWFTPSSAEQEGHRLYLEVVSAARAPKFYTEYGVPDHFDGRFDMIALQLFLVARRLKHDGSESATECLRALMEAFFADMDRSLREMGSSDTGVGKRMKQIAQAFYGRQLAYQTAGDDPIQLANALLKNLYRGDETQAENASSLAAYLLETMQQKTTAEH